MAQKHVLLVDDDEDDREFFLSVLDVVDQSIECKTAENGLDAIDLLNHANRLPDLIFLDLNMPVMNGRQFLRQIKNQDGLKNIPVIVLSTSSDQTTLGEVKQLGATDFITKPNKLSLLEERLTEIFTHLKFSGKN